MGLGASSSSVGFRPRLRCGVFLEEEEGWAASKMSEMSLSIVDRLEELNSHSLALSSGILPALQAAPAAAQWYRLEWKLMEDLWISDRVDRKEVW